jgi:DNA-binding NarL/FixJ family response regulator
MDTTMGRRAGPASSSRLGFSLPAGRAANGMISRMGTSILVVDDDPAFRKLARRLLTAAGLTVVGEADSASAAMIVAKAMEPDAVLVDVDLPDRDGITLAHELTALPWRPRVLLTSVDADAASPDAVLRSGAMAFVHKADLPNGSINRLLAAE